MLREKCTNFEEYLIMFSLKDARATASFVLSPNGYLNGTNGDIGVRYYALYK